MNLTNQELLNELNQRIKAGTVNTSLEIEEVRKLNQIKID